MFIEGVNRTGRQIRQAQARFDREIDAFKAKQKREERERVASIKERRVAQTAEAKAILASDEAKPWITALAQRTEKTIKQTEKFLASEARWNPERIIKWAQEKRAN